MKPNNVYNWFHFQQCSAPQKIFFLSATVVKQLIENKHFGDFTYFISNVITPFKRGSEVISMIQLLFKFHIIRFSYNSLFISRYISRLIKHDIALKIRNFLLPEVRSLANVYKVFIRCLIKGLEIQKASFDHANLIF